MDKGKGGKGKKGTHWAREPGTYPYLKNFRRGLRFQRERALRDMHAAPDDEKSAAQDRWCWALQKKWFFDHCNEIIVARAVTQQGTEMQYGSMGPKARRCLTKEEIRWNAAFIEEEAEEQRRGSASACHSSNASA